MFGTTKGNFSSELTEGKFETLRVPKVQSTFETFSSELTQSKFEPGKSLHFDFFDVKKNKKLTNSKNQHIVQIETTTSYQQNLLTHWLSAVKNKSFKLTEGKFGTTFGSFKRSFVFQSSEQEKFVWIETRRVPIYIKW